MQNGRTSMHTHTHTYTITHTHKHTYSIDDIHMYIHYYKQIPPVWWISLLSLISDSEDNLYINWQRFH